MLSLMQQDPSVCSCADIGAYWRGVDSDYDTWGDIESSHPWHWNRNRRWYRTCCDRTRCELTHHTPDDKGYRDNIAGATSRRSQQRRLKDMAVNWLIITCTESDREWLIDNQHRKPYFITQANHPRQVLPEWEPTNYARYSARVHIPFQSLWSDQGIRECVQQISQGFDLTLDPDHSVELARAWWRTQSDVGIEPPCI